MPKRDILPYEDDRLVLRMLEAVDLPLTRSWRNQDDIRKWFLNSDVITEEQHGAWFERYSKLDNDFVFIILAKELGATSVGQVSLYDIDWDTGIAEYGRLMIGHPDARGKGYARHATNLVLRIGFEYLKLKEIHLEVKEDNFSAQKIYLDCGFTEISRGNQLVKMKIYAPRFTRP
jgi:RimJ/RimL family protein N-acetyltransferase